MKQPGDLINQKLSIGRLFIGGKMAADKGTGQVQSRKYQQSLMALHLTSLKTSRDCRTELHLVIQDAYFPVFCLSVIWIDTQRNPIPAFFHFHPFSSPSNSCLMILLETLTYKVISGLSTPTQTYSPSTWYHCPVKKSILPVVLGTKKPQ